MNKTMLIDYIKQGREIEFEYLGNKYSITYGTVNGNNVISFCEFDKESVEVFNIDDVLKIFYNGKTLLDMWESLSEKDIWIY